MKIKKNINKKNIAVAFFLILIGTTTKLYSQTFTIPDNRFEQRLIDLGIDTDKEVNGLVSKDDVNQITKLDLSNKLIYDLTGIEFFSSLINFNCSNNKISRIDVSKLKYLEKLNCSSNTIQFLDLTNNTDLQILSCSKNQLSTLDLSENLIVKKVSCSNNQLESMAVTAPTLTYLDFSNNNVESIDLNEAKNLKKLICSNNKLKKLEIANNNSLEKLICDNNQLRSLSLKKNNKRRLTFLNAIFNPNLECIEVDEVQYAQNATWVVDKSIEFTLSCSTYIEDENFEKALIELGYDSGLPDNKIQSTIISKVKSLNLSKKNIKSLVGIEGFSSLKILQCYSNNITHLDLSKNKNLKEVNCQNNQIKTINLSGLDKLELFIANKNTLSDCDFSSAKSLKKIYLNNNDR